MPMRVVILLCVSMTVVAELLTTLSLFSKPKLRGDAQLDRPRSHTDTGLPAIFTTNADFEAGTLFNVNYDIDNQLQLDNKPTPFNIIWVACSDRGTVVKVDTKSGKVLGEYRSTPTSHGPGSPSRTTVDPDGSVWLSNRFDVYEKKGSIVHIGLKENNQCHDRNRSEIIDSSTGLGDIRAWDNKDVATAKDECIVHYTKVNSEGTRHLSIDQDFNVWVSGQDLQNFDLVKGGRFDVVDSGTIIRSELSVQYGGYGGLIDPNGVLWSAGPLLRWDTSKPLTGSNGDPQGNDIGPTKKNMNWAGQEYPDSYGLCIDSSGNVWNTEYGSYIHKYNKDGKHLGTFFHGYSRAQGCVVDSKDDVWVAHSKEGTSVGHLRNDGTLVGTVDLEGGEGPTGVAVDGNGKIWATNFITNTLSRIDPAGNGGIGEVDMTVNLGNGCAPYNYGDMTGSTNIAPPISGVWEVVHEMGGDIPTKIVWNAVVPNGAELKVSIKNPDSDKWESVSNGQDMRSFRSPIHIQVLFKRSKTGKSPVLKDLSILDNEPPRCADAVANPSLLWPPNHKFKCVFVKNVTDPDGDAVKIVVTRIFQDEPRLKKRKKKYPDARIIEGGAKLRVKRRKQGNGRVYHIFFKADDGNGGTCMGEVTACVPTRKGKKTCMDGGAKYNSLG